MEARPEYILEADGDKTIVHHVAEGELFGMMRLMKPVAALLARSERARTIESLKRSLESNARGPDQRRLPASGKSRSAKGAGRPAAVRAAGASATQGSS